MFYTAKEFATNLNARPGVVKLFRKMLQDSGKIGVRQKLDDNDVVTYENAVKIKEQENSTWEHALSLAINGQVISSDKTISEAVGQVIKALDGVELAFKNISDEYSDNIMAAYPSHLGTIEDIINSFEKWKKAM